VCVYVCVCVCVQSDWDFKEMMNKAELFADKYKAEFWPTSSKIGMCRGLSQPLSPTACGSLAA